MVKMYYRVWIKFQVQCITLISVLELRSKMKIILLRVCQHIQKPPLIPITKRLSLFNLVHRVSVIPSTPPAPLL